MMGSLSCLGYGPLSGITPAGMPFLDFFDFITNSVMMPLGALATCVLASRYAGLDRLEAEVCQDGHVFRRRQIFRFMIRFLCPVFVLVILISSLWNQFK